MKILASEGNLLGRANTDPRLLDILLFLLTRKLGISVRELACFGDVLYLISWYTGIAGGLELLIIFLLLLKLWYFWFSLLVPEKRGEG